jgi:hypothetical protein
MILLSKTAPLKVENSAQTTFRFSPVRKRSPPQLLKYETQHNDTQHKGTQHKDTQHKGTQHKDTQHKDTQHNDTQHNDTQHNDKMFL